MKPRSAFLIENLREGNELAIPAGFEPATHGVEIRSSNVGKHQMIKDLSRS
jgi:hypothetical protein